MMVLNTQVWRRWLHDSADRIIVSLARRCAVPLLICDRKTLDYDHFITVL